ncbi:hypothetical protein C8J56DRAFT_1031456 [Mycena floridula]|nr:hypothetical protein C8J56DRAFT_1031456 [Mycena floridula]
MSTDLPVELWLHILSFLPPHFVKRLIGVNRVLFNLAQDDIYQEMRLGEDWQSEFAKMSASDIMIARRIQHLHIDGRIIQWRPELHGTLVKFRVWREMKYRARGQIWTNMSHLSNFQQSFASLQNPIVLETFNFSLTQAPPGSDALTKYIGPILLSQRQSLKSFSFSCDGNLDFTALFSHLAHPGLLLSSFALNLDFQSLGTSNWEALNVLLKSQRESLESLTLRASEPANRLKPPTYIATWFAMHFPELEFPQLQTLELGLVVPGYQFAVQAPSARLLLPRLTTVLLWNDSTINLYDMLKAFSHQQSFAIETLGLSIARFGIDSLEEIRTHLPLLRHLEIRFLHIGDHPWETREPLQELESEALFCWRCTEDNTHFGFHWDLREITVMKACKKCWKPQRSSPDVAKGISKLIPSTRDWVEMMADVPPEKATRSPGAQIPPELYPNILGNIQEEQQLTCFLVCRAWRDIVQAELFREISAVGAYQCHRWNERLTKSPRIANMVRSVVFGAWDYYDHLIGKSEQGSNYVEELSELRSLTMKVVDLVDLIRLNPLFHSFPFSDIAWNWEAVSTRANPGGSTRASMQLLDLRCPGPDTIALLLSPLFDLRAVQEVQFIWWDISISSMASLRDGYHCLAAERLFHAISSSNQLFSLTLVDHDAESDTERISDSHRLKSRSSFIIPSLGFNALCTLDIDYTRIYTLKFASFRGPLVILKLRAPLLENITVRLTISAHATSETLSVLEGWSEVDNALTAGQLLSLRRVSLAFKLNVQRLQAKGHGMSSGHEGPGLHWSSYPKDKLQDLSCHLLKL